MDLDKTKKYLQWGNFYLHQIFNQVIAEHQLKKFAQRGGSGMTFTKLKEMLTSKRRTDGDTSFDRYRDRLIKTSKIDLNYSCNFLGLDWVIAKIKTDAPGWVTSGYGDKWKLGEGDTLTQVHYNLINRAFKWDGLIHDIGLLQMSDGVATVADSGATAASAAATTDETVGKTDFNQYVVEVQLDTDIHIGNFFGSILIDILHDHNYTKGPLHPTKIKQLRGKFTQKGPDNWWGLGSSTRLSINPKKVMGDLSYVLICLCEFCWNSNNRTQIMALKQTCQPVRVGTGDINPDNLVKRRLYLRIEQAVFKYFQQLNLYGNADQYRQFRLPYPPKRKDSLDLEQIQFNHQLIQAQTTQKNKITGCSGLGGWHISPGSEHSVIFDQSSNPAGCFLVNEVPVRYNVPNLTDPGGSFRTSISPSEQYSACINEVENLKQIIIDYTNFIYHITIVDNGEGGDRQKHLMLEIDYSLTGSGLRINPRQDQLDIPDVRVPYILYNGLACLATPYKMASAGAVKKLVDNQYEHYTRDSRFNSVFNIGQIIWSKLFGDLGQVLSTVGNQSIFVSGDRSACALALMINGMITDGKILLYNQKQHGERYQPNPVTKQLHLNVCLSNDFWLINIITQSESGAAVATATASTQPDTVILTDLTEYTPEQFQGFIKGDGWATLDKSEDRLHAYVDELLDSYQVYQEIVLKRRILRSEASELNNMLEKLFHTLSTLDAAIPVLNDTDGGLPTPPEPSVDHEFMEKSQRIPSTESLSSHIVQGTVQSELLQSFASLAGKLINNIDSIRKLRRQHFLKLIKQEATSKKCTTNYLLNWVRAYLSWEQRYDLREMEQDHQLTNQLIGEGTPEGLISGTMMQVAISKRQMDITLDQAELRYNPEKRNNERDRFEISYLALWDIIYQVPGRLHEIVAQNHTYLLRKQDDIRRYEDMFQKIHEISGKIIERVDTTVNIINKTITTLQERSAPVILANLRESQPTLFERLPGERVTIVESLLMLSGTDIPRPISTQQALATAQTQVQNTSSSLATQLPDITYLDDTAMAGNLQRSVGLLEEITSMTLEIRDISDISESQ